MAVLTWDAITERIYQTGVDHGVLYLQDGRAVTWNGLIDVEEGTNQELKPYYLDGVKFLETLTPGDYVGKLKAITYPDEFNEVNGIAEVAPGLSYYEQPPKTFNLSYRSFVGDALHGAEFAYKIHILYNLLANPDAYTFSSQSDSSVGPTEFSWSLSGTPSQVVRRRPTVHISIDSRTTPPEILELIENMLYGTDETEPSLPSLQDISELFGYLGALIIVDYGDGSWGAIDEGDAYITMLDPTTFQIDSVDATYSDADTYTVSSTNVGG